MSPEAPALAGRQERLAQLREERDFLLTSLQDLEREHAAGDVDAADYATLRSSYVSRAAEALRELQRLESVEASQELGLAREQPWAGGGSAAQPDEGQQAATAERLRRFLGRRRTRRVLGVLGLCCVLGIAGIAAAHFAGVRLPGESATGSIQLPTATEVRQDLAQAEVLGSAGEVSQAMALYDQVLAAVPHQPEAMAYRGWLIRLSGLASHAPKVVTDGDEQLAEVARIAPGYADGRAFYGVALLEDQGELGASLVQFRGCLADHPSSDLLEAVGPKMAAAFTRAKQPLPAALRRYRASGSGG